MESALLDVQTQLKDPERKIELQGDRIVRLSNRR
jgi:hypothetical protein